MWSSMARQRRCCARSRPDHAAEASSTRRTPLIRGGEAGALQAVEVPRTVGQALAPDEVGEFRLYVSMPSRRSVGTRSPARRSPARPRRAPRGAPRPRTPGQAGAEGGAHPSLPGEPVAEAVHGLHVPGLARVALDLLPEFFTCTSPCGRSRRSRPEGRSISSSRLKTLPGWRPAPAGGAARSA